jgi:hypothetical protein
MNLVIAPVPVLQSNQTLTFSTKLRLTLARYEKALLTNVDFYLLDNNYIAVQRDIKYE